MSSDLLKQLNDALALPGCAQVKFFELIEKAAKRKMCTLAAKDVVPELAKLGLKLQVIKDA